MDGWLCLLCVALATARAHLDTVQHPYSVLKIIDGSPEWFVGHDEPFGYVADAPLGIPRILHRSHKFTANNVPNAPRLWENLKSCVLLNNQYETRYYDDAQVDIVLQTWVDRHGDETTRGALRRLTTKPLSDVFVLRADWFRLAALHLFGGWWLDGDVRCIDRIDDVLGFGTVAEEIASSFAKSANTQVLGRGHREAACLLAWEGELPQEVSSPLNWAVGCPQGHPFLKGAMTELSRRVLRLQPQQQQDPFAARVMTDQGLQYVNVLETTGPALFGEALMSYAGKDLRSVRLEHGEMIDEPETWDTVSIISGASQAPVVVLPFCFFRSRGCAHLASRFRDEVVFHHEFDTSWRPSFWHNYLPSTSEL